MSIAKIIREQIYSFIFIKLISIEGNKFFSKDQGKNGGTTRSGISFGRGEKKKKKRGGEQKKQKGTFQIPFKPQVHIPQILANTATNPNCGHSGVRIKERVTSNNRCNDWKLLNHSLGEGKGNGPSVSLDKSAQTEFSFCYAEIPFRTFLLRVSAINSLFFFSAKLLNSRNIAEL